MSPDKKKIQKIFNQIDKLAAKGKEYIHEYHKLVDDLVEKGDYNYFELALFYSYSIDIKDYSSLLEVKNKTWNEILFQTNSPVSRKIKRVFDNKGVYQMGFDVFSDSLNSVVFEISNPLSTSYLTTSSTQSISLSIQNKNVYISSNDSDISKFEISRCKWDIIDGVDKPVIDTLYKIQDIRGYVTQSSYRTEIPTTAGVYLITTETKGIDFSRLNYKVSVTRNTFLGQIKEIDTLSDDSKYYLQNKQFARLIGTRVTYLEVTKFGATQSLIIQTDLPSASEDTNLVKRYKIAVDYLLS